MGQSVSELWKTLWNTEGTGKEYAFEINGVWYGKEAEVDHDTEAALFEDYGIGNAYIGSLRLGLYAPTIPKGAEIKRHVRLVNGDTVSEWIPKGVFYANRRSEEDGYWQIEAFDGMRKSEKVWEPDRSLSFPLSMPDAVDEFARIMGVELDSRTVLNSSYMIDYPSNEYTIRNELCYIAAAHGGNWVMSDSGKLWLVPLLSMPDPTNYLVTERGREIIFGGVRILV